MHQMYNFFLKPPERPKTARDIITQAAQTKRQFQNPSMGKPTQQDFNWWFAGRLEDIHLKIDGKLDKRDFWWIMTGLFSLIGIILVSLLNM